MAKKEDKPSRQIKFLISDEDQFKVRIAAAFKGQSMAEFSRDVVLQKTHELTKNHKLPKGS